MTLLTVALFASDRAWCDFPTVREVVESRNVLEHVIGKRYRYRIETKYRDPGTIASECSEAVSTGERVFEFYRPPQGSTIAPFRVIQTIENPGEPALPADQRVTTFWEVSDGTETRRFCRQLFHDKCKSNLEHFGVIEPGSVHRSSDAFQRTLNYHTCTFMSLSGARPHPPQHSPDSVIEPYEHPKFGTVIFAHRKGQKGGELYTLGPEYLYLRNHNIKGDVTVSELAKFDGYRYPAKGRLANKFLDQTFELISVEPLGEAVIDEDWFPQWPEGSAILDTIQDKVIRVPYTARQTALIKLRLRINRRVESALAEEHP